LLHDGRTGQGKLPCDRGGWEGEECGHRTVWCLREAGRKQSGEGGGLICRLFMVDLLIVGPRKWKGKGKIRRSPPRNGESPSKSGGRQRNWAKTQRIQKDADTAF